MCVSLSIKKKINNVLNDINIVCKSILLSSSNGFVNFS